MNMQIYTQTYTHVHACTSAHTRKHTHTKTHTHVVPFIRVAYVQRPREFYGCHVLPVFTFQGLSVKLQLVRQPENSRIPPVSAPMLPELQAYTWSGLAFYCEFWVFCSWALSHLPSSSINIFCGVESELFLSLRFDMPL